MKLIRFLILILQKGSLRHTPFNFEAEREEILIRIPNQNSSKSLSFLQVIKLRLMKSTFGYSVLANLSYLRHARKMNVMLFVSVKKQLVYCRVLKSASTSMLKELLPHIDPALEIHSLSDEQVDALAFRYVKNELSDEEKQYPKLALVRNPFHRIVSVYLDLFDPSSNKFSYESYWFGILKNKMNFSEFINTIVLIPDFFKGPHFASQYYILNNITSLNAISYFRIDKDQRGLNNFLVAYNINLPYQNKQQRHYDYKSFYNSDLLNKVYEMYRQDVATFDYTDEYNQLLKFVSH